ncbi:amino acid adenylation domain-containing protein [Streptomyces sp. MST-110588]|uniref:non-ribosomal peptide synthetase n=1 Tax=Streptomyces sp. MST-110588 TaxID=2833628 RepID=UPI0020465EF0|nr:amino acid adenylation domain-containing protein [Streptomyces sp. MST-110588]UNO43298.1 amino acid adenylation domain-containing protein [Streptomyces sp. MST-110588]
MTANHPFRASPPAHPRATRKQTAIEPLTDRTAPLALSFAQQRLWFLAQMRGASQAYHMPQAFRLRGPLDRTVLARSLDALVDRHEVLRTRLAVVAGEPVQRIGPPGTGFALRTEDLTGRPDAESRLRELREQAATAPFDLAQDPPARGLLITLAEDDHVLLLTLHHIASDGWSMGVLTRELGALYTALLQGSGNPLPPLPVQYADYAAWQRERLSRGALAKQADYWRKALAHAPASLELPTDRPRPAEQDYRGGRLRLEFGTELTTALKSLSRRHGSTLFMTVLTGWALVLSRLSGQESVVIGTPTANRRRAELEGLIGFFVNALALPIDLSGKPTVAELLKRVRGATLSALEHQDLPFEQVVELVNPARSPARTPLFQTMFAWQNSEEGVLELPGIKVTPLDSPYRAAKFDLTLSLAEEDGRITGGLDYAEALFDAATTERYGRYLRRVLKQMAQDPDAAAGALTLLDERERRQVLVEWNDTGHRAVAGTGSGTGSGVESGAGAGAGTAAGSPEEPMPLGLIERFEAQARQRPAQPAVVCEGERLDYATLERRANRLAHALISRGVRPDQVVGLHTGRTAALVVGILGILKAGAGYLPLDPALPREWLAGMVKGAAPALVLSDAAVPPNGWQSLTAVEAGGTSEDAPGVAVHPDGLAYVIHTSGSTGRPKGVAVPRGSVVNLLDHWLTRFDAAPGEAMALWSGIGFDCSVQEIWLPLTTGGVLHLVPEDLRADPDALMDWLRTHRVVHAFLPPAFVKWIDEAPAERLAGLSLRQLLTGVEPIPEQALHRMQHHLPGLRVLNGYGPTEATVYSTAYLGPRPLPRRAPIGRPLANTRVYLLDDRLEPVPVGVAGEVFIGGAGLARGYLGRPDLTAERFVPDPFVPGERMYRTGDLARLLPDGNAEYVGRRDQQLKLRGFRIEPGEIEAALLAEPGVHEAAVLADTGGTGEPRLVAAVGRAEAAPRLPEEWRAALSRRLPGYMIPALFVELPRLPRTPNGKLDHAALLERAREESPVQVNLASPRDHIELALYQIWQRLLVRTGIGVRDSFFDIGGSSISAIKLAHAVRAEFGQNLQIRDILLHPTIEALGGLLRQGAAKGQGHASKGPRSAARGPDSNLIAFREGDGRRRVVCVHPAGGTAFCYLPLAKALPDDCGVYGVQSPGVNPDETFLPTVEAMADAYLRLIEPLPDAGPLVLTGLSYGGLIAHEMGRRLARAGHRKVSVVLLDTQGSDDPAERAAVAPVEMAEFRDKLVKFNGMYPGIDDAQIDRYFRIYNHNRLTARDYLPPPSPARLVLMQAVEDGQDTPFLRGVRDFWRRRADGDFLVEPLHCDHWEVLESAEVPRVAARIASELARFPDPGPPASAGEVSGPAQAQEK